MPFKKMQKKKVFFTVAFFKIHIIHFEIQMDRPEFKREFFSYFNALETRGDRAEVDFWVLA